MFLNPEDFPFVEMLQAHCDEILLDLEGISRSRFEAWAVTKAYLGHWSGFGLFHHHPDWVMAEHCKRHRTECPRIQGLLAQIPGLLTAGFSRLAPGSHIYPHSDLHPIPSIRCHMGLIVNPFARFRVGSETRIWERGKCLVFHGSTEHAAANEGDEDRVILLVDVATESAKAPLLPSLIGN